MGFWGRPSQTREEVGLSRLATENPEVFEVSADLEAGGGCWEEVEKRSRSRCTKLRGQKRWAEPGQRQWDRARTARRTWSRRSHGAAVGGGAERRSRGFAKAPGPFSGRGCWWRCGDPLAPLAETRRS